LGDERTDGWTSMSWWGSGLAESFVKIAAAAALSAFFLWKFRRWSEATLLVGALVLEVMIFTTSSFVVDRARPGVPKLDTIPPTSSFPSGHAAAAVAFYGALAIIVFWHTRHRVARAVVVGAAIVFPLIVGASRMYRGMHHLSDVIVGFVVGGVALWVTYLVVNERRSQAGSVPERETGSVPERGSGSVTGWRDAPRTSPFPSTRRRRRRPRRPWTPRTRPTS
jgi:undecaprenyl-diphosphatase